MTDKIENIGNNEMVLIAALNEVVARLFWSKSNVRAIEQKAQQTQEVIRITEGEVKNLEKLVYTIYNNQAELQKLDTQGGINEIRTC